MTSVAVIDYGAGNLDSVRRAFAFAGADSVIARTPEDVMSAERIVLPGVGAAGEALASLRAVGLDAALTEAVRKRARPFLGICLGMQMLAETLHEFGEHRGLGWLSGEVVALRDLVGPPLRVPHMGWNQVRVASLGDDLFWEVRGKREFYFSHSFVLVPSQASAFVAATSEYGVDITAAVLDGTVFATQFHPEKSQVNGERLITAFLDWKP